MDALAYARELVAFDSTSRRSNADVSDCIETALRSLGFEIERVEQVDGAGVRKVNVLGRKGARPADETGGLAYFAHSDVVPADDWHDDVHGPFDPVVRDGRLYGRGSCDMKGSLAAMLAAASRFQPAELARPLYVVVTADEETGFHGAKQVAARSELYRELKATVAAGIIGEPTLLEVVHAHKGSCGFRVTSRGEAAHSSSAAGRNANLAMIPFLVEMKTLHDETEADAAWRDARFDPPTVSWNIGINDGNPAINVKAARSVCTVYFRPTPNLDFSPLLARVRRSAAANDLELKVFFEAEPFYVSPDAEVVRELLTIAGRDRPRTVCFGTDAAVFGELGRLAVWGPGDIAQAHTRDEWIALEQLVRGTDLYAAAIRRWCV